MIDLKPHLILVALFLMVPIGFFTTYGIAVGLHHVTAEFPYISDTGTEPPESCLFGQFLDIGAAMIFYIGLMRYHHIKSIIDADETNLFNKLTITRFNKIGFFINIVSAFGITMVGNFQETNVMAVHLIGAFMAFVALHVYCWIQVFLSHKLSSTLYSTKCMLIFRVVLCIIGLINMVLVGIFSLISRELFNGKNSLIWKPTDGGYAEHIVATSNEWSLSILSVLTLLTLYPDFKNISFSSIKIHDRQNTINYSIKVMPTKLEE